MKAKKRSILLTYGNPETNPLSQSLDSKHSVLLKSVSVGAKYRGNKYSELLINKALAWSLANGFDEMCLEAEEDTARHNKLVHLYERFGFQEVPSKAYKYLYNDEQTFRVVCMRVNLHEWGQGQTGRNVQNEDFVARMRKETASKQHGRVSVQEAVHQVDALFKGSWEFALRLAEECRAQDYPEWMQFACLLHNLGEYCRVFEDWESPFYYKTFEDGEHQGMLPDWVADSPRTVLHEHLEGVELENKFTWTPCEYLYTILRVNQASFRGLPEEFFEVLRYQDCPLNTIPTDEEVYAWLESFKELKEDADKGARLSEERCMEVEVGRWGFFLHKFLVSDTLSV